MRAPWFSTAQEPSSRPDRIIVGTNEAKDDNEFALIKYVIVIITMVAWPRSGSAERRKDKCLYIHIYIYIYIHIFIYLYNYLFVCICLFICLLIIIRL